MFPGWHQSLQAVPIINLKQLCDFESTHFTRSEILHCKLEWPVTNINIFGDKLIDLNYSVNVLIS